MRWMPLGIVLLAATGCGDRLRVVAATAPPVETAAEPVSFGALEQQVEELIADTRDADRRDRLIAMRELMFAMRGRDPVAQQRVYAYLVKAIAIERRSAPQPIGEGGTEPLILPIAEEVIPVDAAPTPTPAPAPTPAPTPAPAPAPAPTPAPAPAPTPAPAPPPAPGAAALPGAPPAAVAAVPVLDRNTRVARARAALDEGDALAAVALLDGLTDGEAKLLRQEAVDAWADAEVRAAANAIAAAEVLPAGPDRDAALLAARARLAAVNDRFPGNAFRPRVLADLARIDGLVGAGATP